jgi:hypothetical protein
MSQGSWSKKRGRQYEHIKGGLLDRGEDEEASEKGTDGRSKMNAAELERAVGR